MHLRAAVVYVIVLSVTCGTVTPCTTVFTSSGETRLAAFNLDCDNYFPRVWFVPAGEEGYGRFCFGTDESERIAEGGMNDQGLFIAVNALNEAADWRPDPDLPDWTEWDGWFGAGVPDGILARCATVEQAVEVFKSYNLFTLANVKFLIADAAGASVVVEWSAGALRFVPRQSSGHQISTNFVTSDYAAADVPCGRYSLAERMLSAAGRAADADLLRRVLSATHLEFQTPTILSTICDLKTGDIRLYYFHYFDAEIVFNLHEELKKGRHGGLLGDLAPLKPYVATVYEEIAAPD